MVEPNAGCEKREDARAFEYVTTQKAQAAQGLRMFVVSGVPSPWVEAAKRIFHAKGVDWLAVYLDPRDPVHATWAGQTIGPVAFWQGEAPVNTALDMLALAERIAPEPALVPQDHADEVRAVVHPFAGRDGLGWCRRAQQVAAGLAGQHRSGLKRSVGAG
ncbi:hypothetical protein SAMN04488523_10115 [Sulfitobacter brevis]|uniref:Uncharacterized protein n=1 Tax=Sulfitobacter brevis TaxID=74348 RepID=A0A1I1SKH9_9RHOB|nr:hypothetical protein SAMN04488523_10115 [Sulfitobacter brevis]